MRGVQVNVWSRVPRRTSRIARDASAHVPPFSRAQIYGPRFFKVKSCGVGAINLHPFFRGSKLMATPQKWAHIYGPPSNTTDDTTASGTNNMTDNTANKTTRKSTYKTTYNAACNTACATTYVESYDTNTKQHAAQQTTQQRAQQTT